MSNSYPGPSMAGAVDLSGLVRRNAPAPTAPGTTQGHYVRDADDQTVGFAGKIFNHSEFVRDLRTAEYNGIGPFAG